MLRQLMERKNNMTKPEWFSELQLDQSGNARLEIDPHHIFHLDPLACALVDVITGARRGTFVGRHMEEHYPDIFALELWSKPWNMVPVM